MESANFHHQQVEQDDEDDGSSCYGLAWYQNPILNRSSNNIISSRDPKQQHVDHNNINLSYFPNSYNNTPMTQDSDFTRIKDELSVSGSYPDLSEITSNQDLLLTNYSTVCQIPSSIPYSNVNATNSGSRGTFSQIFPTINISSLNHQSLQSGLFGSPRSNEGFSPHASSLHDHNLDGLFKDTCLYYGILDQMHQPVHERPIICPSKMPLAFTSASTDEAKRPPINAPVPKKLKSESRPSCTPLKVRKEKLGNRIAALQQLVAPFGKTDTASVLMEAIGYIKFLQNQVQTLSVPYMKSTHKSNRVSTRGGSLGEGNEETKRGLKSRGLCLVPLSCLSYVTYGGGGI